MEQYFSVHEKYGLVKYSYSLGIRGNIFVNLLEKWGMVTSTEIKEDSQGRAFANVTAPQEVVNRAAEIADLAVTYMENAGWIKKVENNG